MIAKNTKFYSVTYCCTYHMITAYITRTLLISINSAWVRHYNQRMVGLSHQWVVSLSVYQSTGWHINWESLFCVFSWFLHQCPCTHGFLFHCTCLVICIPIGHISRPRFVGRTTIKNAPNQDIFSQRINRMKSILITVTSIPNALLCRLHD